MVLKIRKFSYAISLALCVASVIFIFIFGLNLGIDFTGGSVIEAEFNSRPDIGMVRSGLEKLEIGQIVIQPRGINGYSIKTKELSTEERQEITSELSKFGEIKDVNVNTIGPTIGRELRSKSLIAMIMVLSAIILYIAFAFRKVSEPVSSWYYGLFAIVALFHDVLIPIGVFSLLGHYMGVEVDTLFVTAILTVLGFSVHDTIVVFDRIRENLGLSKKETFEEIVGKSLNQTIARSINTSLTVLIVLAALYFLGAEATKYFALTLIIGILAGTYSSIFIASPLLVSLNNYRLKRIQK